MVIKDDDFFQVHSSSDLDQELCGKKITIFGVDLRSIGFSLHAGGLPCVNVSLVWGGVTLTMNIYSICLV